MLLDEVHSIPFIPSTSGNWFAVEHGYVSLIEINIYMIFPKIHPNISITVWMQAFGILDLL